MLECQEGNEANIAETYRKYAKQNGISEVVCFEYQRMLRYGGKWHLERRPLLPGRIFLAGAKTIRYGKNGAALTPCEVPCVKALCQEGNLIGISSGFIHEGKIFITSGPLKGQEDIIRKIDRHKRTAQIEISFGDQKIQVTVGLEIYEKV